MYPRSREEVAVIPESITLFMSSHEPQQECVCVCIFVYIYIHTHVRLTGGFRS